MLIFRSRCPPASHVSVRNKHCRRNRIWKRCRRLGCRNPGVSETNYTSNRMSYNGFCDHFILTLWNSESEYVVTAGMTGALTGGFLKMFRRFRPFVMFFTVVPALFDVFDLYLVVRVLLRNFFTSTLPAKIFELNESQSSEIRFLPHQWYRSQVWPAFLVPVRPGVVSCFLHSTNCISVRFHINATLEIPIDYIERILLLSIFEAFCYFFCFFSYLSKNANIGPTTDATQTIQKFII